MTDHEKRGSGGATSTLYTVASAIYVVGFLHLLYRACVEAYQIRLYAIEEYGRVIHEFDPYFNYRAAEVSHQNLII
jgi:dolichyl-diphosphooligosaccharide--protein glycosyltransferase